jgi:hypothetical protein
VCSNKIGYLYHSVSKRVDVCFKREFPCFDYIVIAVENIIQLGRHPSEGSSERTGVSSSVINVECESKIRNFDISFFIN